MPKKKGAANQPQNAKTGFVRQFVFLTSWNVLGCAVFGGVPWPRQDCHNSNAEKEWGIGKK